MRNTVTRFRLWCRWTKRLGALGNYREAGKTYHQAASAVVAQYPMTVQEYIYDHMARKRGRPPAPWDPPPKTADAESFATELREKQRVAGLSEDERADELLNGRSEFLARQASIEFRDFIQEFAENPQESHQAIEGNRLPSKLILLFFGAIIAYGVALLLGMRWLLPHLPFNIVIVLLFAMVAAVIWDLFSTWRKAFAESGNFGEAAGYLFGHITVWSLITAAVYGAVWLIA